MPRMRRRSLTVLVLAGALVAPASAPAQTAPNVEAQILAFNDFHGHLESTTPGTISPTGATADRVAAGGAEYLAAHLRALRAARNSTTVAVGDNIGGSPLISALFRDEPT